MNSTKTRSSLSTVSLAPPHTHHTYNIHCFFFSSGSSLITVQVWDWEGKKCFHIFYHSHAWGNSITWWKAQRCVVLYLYPLLSMSSHFWPYVCLCCLTVLCPEHSHKVWQVNQSQEGFASTVWQMGVTVQSTWNGPMSDADLWNSLASAGHKM